MVQFSHPWWLFAVAAAGVPAALAVWAARRGRRASAPAVAMQVLATALAALALAGPKVSLGGWVQRPYLVLRDVSASARGQGEPPLALPPEVRAERHDFAAAVVPAGGAVDADRTQPESALQLALARARDLAGVVIWTDGQFASDAWRPLAAAIGRSGLATAVVPMESPAGDGRIADFAAARRPDGTVELRVTVAATGGMRRRLKLWREGTTQAPLLDRDLELSGGASTLRASDEPPADRSAVYRAELSAGDDFPQNDSAFAMVLPKSQRIAVVGDGAALAALGRQLNTPAEPIAPQAAPDRQAGWEDYAAVVLVDATGEALALPQRQALARYVRGGGGLLLVGAGPYGGPQDRDDPLNRVAALLANPYQRRPLEVAVVLDASGSMAEPADAGAAQVKFDLAREAVLALRRYLTEHDGLSIVTFADHPQQIYGSGQRPDFSAVAAALARVQPGGPTDVKPALGLATANPPPPGKDGLVLLVSDLLTQPFDAHAMAERFRDRHWSLAAVAIASPGSSQPAKLPLEQLAEDLNAPLVRRANLTALAEVFQSFLRQARGPAIRQGRFDVTAEASLFGRGGLAFPPLQAYLLCAARDGAEVLMKAGGDPVLARRQVGLGRSVSLAVPLTGQENPAWQQAESTRDLLAAAAGWVLRPGDDSRFACELQRTGGRLRIDLRASDSAGPMNLLKLRAMIEPSAAAEGWSPIAPLEQAAPGRYQGELAAPAGPAGVVVEQQGGRTVWRGVLQRSYPDEFARIGADWRNLRALEELTGGRIVAREDLSLTVRRLRQRQYVDLWPYLLAAAVATMLLEWVGVGIRRR